MHETMKTTALALVLALAVPPALEPAAATDEYQEVVDAATETLHRFAKDPNLEWFRHHVKDAHGVFIVPRLVRAGFFFGGSGGSGVFVARDPDTGEWSYPAFYSMGSASAGLQFGGEVVEMILMMMTENGVDAMLASEIKLGADVSVTLGPIGAGTKAATADVLAFSRSKGFFGGVMGEGSWIEPRDGWNETYYGTPVSPSDILVRRKVSNPAADPLRIAIATVSR